MNYFYVTCKVVAMKETFVVNGKSIRDKCLEASRLFDDWGILPEDRDDMSLAIDEALTNIYEHGYEANDVKDCTVSIEVFKGEKDVYIVIADYARQFSMDHAQGPNIKTYVESSQIGGFGIGIIKKIMSSARVIRLFDENVLIMHKSIRFISNTFSKVLTKTADNILQNNIIKESKNKLFSSVLFTNSIK
ncbi:MAG: ATP-binding protein [Spirochaetia bacterium]|nr:ATP-binding protein [Spirochaetia bacterium]